MKTCFRVRVTNYIAYINIWSCINVKDSLRWISLLIWKRMMLKRVSIVEMIDLLRPHISCFKNLPSDHCLIIDSHILFLFIYNYRLSGILRSILVDYHWWITRLTVAKVLIGSWISVSDWDLTVKRLIVVRLSSWLTSLRLRIQIVVVMVLRKHISPW